MNRNLCILLLLSLLITSCKRHLTKSTAKKQIILMNHYPVDKEYQFTKSFIKDENTEGRGVTVILGEEEFADEQKMIEKFEANGLVTFTEIPHREETTAWLMGTTVRTWTTVQVSITNKGKGYVINEDDNSIRVKLWEIDFCEIIQIQEQPTSTTVEYNTVNRKITLFGHCFENESYKKERKSSNFFKTDGKWKLMGGQTNF